MLGIAGSISNKENDSFNPLRLKGCRLWYDFMDPTFIFSDAGVTNVNHNDAIYRIHNKAFFCQESSLALKALGSYIEQGTASRRPIWKKDDGASFAAASGGESFLLGNSGIGGVSGSGGSGVFSNLQMKNSNFTLFMVLTSDSTNFTAPDTVFSLQGPDSNDLIQLTLKANPGNFIVSLNSGGGLGPKVSNNTVTDVAMPAEKRLFTLNSTGALANAFYRSGRTSLNSTAAVNATTSDRAFASALSALCLGDSSTPANSFMHTYQEIIMYSDALSRDDAYEVEKYLMHKHNLAIHNSRT